MYKLRVPEIAERMFRALNLRGALPEVVQEKYDASITVEDLTTYDYAYLRRTTSWVADITAVAGGVGTVAIATLRQITIGGVGNISTNVIAMVDSVIIRNTTAGVLQVGWSLAYAGSGNVSTNSSALPRDSRQGNVPNFNIDVPLAAAYPLVRPTYHGFWNVPANDTREFVVNVTLGPSGAFSLFNMNTATAFQAMIHYRERTAAESELR